MPRRRENLRRLDGEPHPFAVRRDELCETRLVDGHGAGVEVGDAICDDVANHDLIPEVGEAGGRHKADPAGAENADRLTDAAHFNPASGWRPFAIASIVSFDSSRRIVFETQ